MASVGIDLGTTYSCVAGVKNGKIEVIANRHGSRIMPSWVAFTDTERLVGETAKSKSMSEPQNTIYDAKRIIGRHFNDVDLLSDIKRWPFCVFNAQGKPKIRVQYKKQTQEFFPEEISGLVLSKMKEIAQNYLGKEVKKAVITVPAYFGMEQRKATKDAAKCAGLEVLEIVNEPTAAAFAFGLLEKSVEQRNVLIYDLGGGTFDVTVMTITGREKFDVRSTSGNTHLGGQDFNENLVQHLIKVIDKECDIKIASQPRKLAQLRADCERVKIELSSGYLATVRLYGLCDGDDFETSVGRAKFEELNEELFESTLEIVDKALEDAGMSECDIDDVALVGGSTRIPKIQELLKEHFEDIELTMSNNPDESVAYGAGVRAAVLGKETVAGIKDMEVRDVIPLSLGVGVFGGATSFIIKRNTKIPCNKTHNFTTLFDNQTGVDIEIFEGERARSANNRSIGSIYLTDITPALAGDARIEVTFKVGENGSSLAASATERSSGKEAALTISLDDGRFSESEVEDLIARSEKFRIDDEEFREKTKALNELVSQTNKVRRDLRRKKKRQDELRKCEEICRWASETKDPSREEIDEKRQELENLHEYF